jgi:hypothetical protein
MSKKSFLTTKNTNQAQRTQSQNLKIQLFAIFSYLPLLQSGPVAKIAQIAVSNLPGLSAVIEFQLFQQLLGVNKIQ